MDAARVQVWRRLPTRVLLAAVVPLGLLSAVLAGDSLPSKTEDPGSSVEARVEAAFRSVALAEDKLKARKDRYSDNFVEFKNDLAPLPASVVVTIVAVTEDWFCLHAADASDPQQSYYFDSSTQEMGSVPCA